MSDTTARASAAAAPRPGRDTAARRTRVLHIIQNLNYGGMERLLADIARHTDAARFETHILALEYLGRFSEGLGEVATLHLASPLPRWSMLWPGPLIRQIRRIAPNVVHSHGRVWYKSSLAARRAGVRRVVHTEHGRQSPDPWLALALDRRAARRTDVAVAVSQALGARLDGEVLRGRCRVAVVTNGVDTALHRPRADTGALRRELGIGADVPVLGSIGRLEPIKGYDVMLRAFAALRAEWSGATATPVLVLVGEGTERARLEALARECGLGRHVHFLGWRDDIAELHAAFTLFTMSSRSEGTSVSLLEAMSAGLCPVVTDVGGNAAVLGDALRHRLVPSESPPALAAAWREALGGPARLEADARAARQRVESAFGLEAMVRAYEALYAGDEG